ncbi:hypothetical protein D3C83_279920 [compost metagenome]
MQNFPGLIVRKNAHEQNRLRVCLGVDGPAANWVANSVLRLIVNLRGHLNDPA